jgi:type II secretory pathway pseudopilin PulG
MNKPYKAAATTSGHTLVEILVAMVLICLVMASAMASWVFFVNHEHKNSTQAELDMDVRKSVERLRYELKRTSLEQIVLYPDGNGPYTALSFPLAQDDDGDGLVEMDGTGTNAVIHWDQTVVYHVWSGSPHQLRRTIFTARDKDMSQADRLAQIESVVENGNGDGASDTETDSVTYTLFANLFTWELNANGSRIDTYNPTPQSEPVYLGYLPLTPGPHTFTFTVVDKHSSSTGHKLAFDTFQFSPCGMPREAEDQLPASLVTGTAPTNAYVQDGGWSANRQLQFAANGVSNKFTVTLTNDCWEETNFGGPGSSGERADSVWNTNLLDFVVELQKGECWSAQAQTTNNPVATVTPNSTYAYRILIKGENITTAGQFPSITVIGRWTHIANPWLAEAGAVYTDGRAPDTTGTPCPLNPSTLSIHPSTATAFTTTVFTATTALNIEKEKNYVLTFLSRRCGQTAAATYRGAYRWTDPNTANYHSFVITNDVAASNNINSATWSTLDSATCQPNNYIDYCSTMNVEYPTNGTYQSQIVDTTIEDPTYYTMTWRNPTLPTGSSLRMRVRSSDNADMSGATSWTNITGMTSGGSIAPGAGRFVQFQATLTAGTTAATATNTPSLRDVRVSWQGVERLTDLIAVIAKGPDKGIFEMTVDGKKMLRTLRLDLTIFKDVYNYSGRTVQMTSSMTTEIQPMNTGK